jgi:hypothetical protein
MVSILFMPFGFIAPKTCLFGFPIFFWFWTSPDKGYSRNASCALNLICTYLFISVIRIRKSKKNRQCNGQNKTWAYLQTTRGKDKYGKNTLKFTQKTFFLSVGRCRAEWQIKNRETLYWVRKQYASSTSCAEASRLN